MARIKHKVLVKRVRLHAVLVSIRGNFFCSCEGS